MKAILTRILIAVMLLTTIAGVPTLAEGERETISVGSAFVFRDGFFDEDVVKVLKDALNIEIKYTFYDADKFSLMLASNDLPDIVCTTQSHLATILENHMALNIDTMIDQTEYIDSEQFAARNDVMRAMLGGDDHGLYFIAPGLGPERVGGGKLPSRGYALRWDYYKEAGYPAVENDEDYLNAMIKMVEKHPETEDGQKIYGIGLYNRLDFFYIRACYLTSVGLNPWTFNGYQYMASWDDCVLYNGYVNPERSAFWTDMSFYNKMYRAGLFDLDSFTQTEEEYTAKLQAGRYVGEVYNYNTLYNAQTKLDPDTMAGMVIIPSSGAYVHANKLNIIGNAPTNTIFISAKSKHKEKAVALLDMMHSPEYIRTLYSGIQGVHWDYDANGKPYLFDETIRLRSENGEECQKTGFGRSTVAQWNMAQPTTRSAKDGYSYELMEEAEYRALGIGKMYEDYCAYYNASYPSDACMQRVYAGEAKDLSGDYAQTVVSGITDIPMDIKRIMDNCNDILYRSLAKLIMAESDEEFEALRDAIIQELEDADEETAWEWCETEFNKVREVIRPIYDEARQVYEANYLGK